MLKTGMVSSTTIVEPLGVVWYSDNSFNERMDIVKDFNKYDIINTEDTVASYIKGTDERYLGDIKLIHAIISTKMHASMLHVAESRNVAVEDGKFVMTISKISDDESTEYITKMVNGRITYERYKYNDMVVEIEGVSDTTYDSSNKPVNWDDYEVFNTIASNDRNNTVKKDQAEFYSYEELLRKYPQVMHVLNPENDYGVVGSYEQGVEKLKIWAESKIQLKSFDIESYSTDWGPDSENRITGVFLGLDEHWSWYFPFRQENFPYNLPIEFLAQIFNAINSQPPAPEVIILAHNVKFELEGFYQEYRKRIRFDVDTYILAVLVDPLVKKGTHTLKALTAKVDGRFYLTLEQIFIGPVRFNVLPPEIVKLYGCPDATSPAKIYKYLMERLPQDEHFVMQLEMKLVPVKACHNEFYGLRMDQKQLDKLLENEQYKVDDLKNRFQRIHRTSRNINSYDTMAEILYYKLRCPVEVMTSKGLPATSKVAIDRIIALGKKKPDEGVPIPEDIKDREGKTIIKGKDLASNKYPSLLIYQAYKKSMKELGALTRLKNHSVNGFFKFYINQVGAGSNRQTSDAHQFSDTMKKCAIADSPHHRLVSCDWSQVELRILAGMAKQLDLMELESDPGVDIHRAICSIIKKTPMYLISEEDRKKAKPVNFGVVYMMSEYGLARSEYGPGYTKEQLAEVRNRIMDFFNGLPCIKEFIKNNEVQLRKNGFIKTAFCYYRYFKELLDPTIDEKTAMKLIRAGNNTPVQGTGAGMMKIVETKVDTYMLDKGWLEEKDYDGRMLPMARMILPIHDEILGSFDKDIPMEEIIKMFKECMELDIKGMPPFFASPAFVDNWFEGKNSVWEIPTELRDKIIEEYDKGNYMLTGHDYLQVLTDYRHSEIKEYMDGLVAQYHTVDEVAKHVQHDSLTHTLIETYIPSKDERKQMTHMERIHEATRRYMEDESNAVGKLPNVQTDTESAESESASEFIAADEWADTYAHIDANGDLIQEEMSEDEQAYYEVPEFDEIDGYSDNIESPRVLYLLNECIIDLTGLDKDSQAEAVNQQIQKIASPTSFYSVVYVIGEQTIATNFKIGYMQKEIEAIFDNVLKGVETHANDT